MASHSYISICHILCFIFLIFIVINSKPVAPQTLLINKICHEIGFTDYCRQVLLSTPSHCHSSRFLLAIRTNEFLRTNVTKSIKQVKVMRAQARQQEEKQNLNVCYKAYKSVTWNNEWISTYWALKKYAKVENEVKEATNKVRGCYLAHTGDDNNEKIQKLLHIILIMAREVKARKL
ncbi:hypothetical protein QQ045_015021 [Rhodiola kirilowii]